MNASDTTVNAEITIKAIAPSLKKRGRETLQGLQPDETWRISSFSRAVNWYRVLMRSKITTHLYTYKTVIQLIIMGNIMHYNLDINVLFFYINAKIKLGH